MELKLLSKLDVKANMAQISPKCENRRRSSDTRFQLSERKLKTWKGVKCLPSYRWESAKSRRAIQKSYRKRAYQAIYTKAKDMSLFKRPLQRLVLLTPIDEN